MKLLSVTVPCYNSQDYMEHCVKTLLAGGEDVEILIVDDGSSDATAQIADRLAKENPTIVRAIHQPNKGHGGAVNTGMEQASGVFFKVVDSDDWVDLVAYAKILKTLRSFVEQSEKVDMLVSNFVYEKQGVAHKKVMRYAGVLPTNRILTWDDVGHFRKGQYLLMHSVIYRTQLLRDCGLKLPEHTFYVDNLYVYQPLKQVQRFYYLDVNFYRYYIGRQDQSVNEKVMIGRIDQQIAVNKLMLHAVRLEKIQNPRQRQYMFNYLEIMTTISSILLIRAGTDEALAKKDALWEDIKREYPWAWNRLRRGLLGSALNMKGKAGQRICVLGYKIAQKLFGFN
ncbi:MAG: glycosyltransferase family 2 protein [Pygmaiobacter massiliensis]|nr:glycosyltransferase family 2 protein [Pygmaiobacter massiliensis]